MQSRIAPDYLVSSEGNVARYAGGQGAVPHKALKQYTAPDGRPSVSIRINGKTKTIRVCNLVADAFISPRPSRLHECCHRDGNPANNRHDNLRWDTSSGNKADMIRHGTRRWGEKHHGARLTPEQVAFVKEMYSDTSMTQAQIGEIVGVSQVQVSRIINGKRWRDPVAYGI